MTTPKRARELLKLTAEVTRSQIENLRHHPSEIERLEYLANAIERFLAGEAKSLDTAFGVKERRGPRSKPGKQFELTKQMMGAPGRSWQGHADALNPQLNFRADARDLRKIYEKQKRAVVEWYGEQIRKAGALRVRLKPKRHPKA